MMESMTSSSDFDTRAAAINSGLTSGIESLPAALDRVYGALTGEMPSAVSSDTPTTRARLPQHDQPCLTLQRLRTIFSLSSFERDVLLLCAGAALETRFLTACAAAHGDPRATWPTFGLALAVLRDAHWSSISRTRPLRYWRLIETGLGPLLHAPLQIDERILQLLLGVPASDERLESLIRPIPIEKDSAASRANDLPQALQSAARRWQHPASTAEPVLLAGTHTSMCHAAFVELCQACDCRPYAMHAADLPAGAAERDQLARLWTREAALSRGALYIQTEQSATEQAIVARHLTSWLTQVRARVALEAPGGSWAEQFCGLRVEVPALSCVERRSAWESHLGPLADRMNGDLDRIVEYFHFDEPGIRTAAAAALEVSTTTADTPGKLTWHVCRQYARRTLDNLARRIEPRISWADLVLPAPQTESLRQIAIHMRQRAVVNERWGFSSRYSRGLGLSALFAGVSGTGKTLAAEILAGELDLDLYQIDLATVVSKYIGETEKNLRRIFDAAEESGAILLFDEADALFGKRSEVRDSHDRYANLEVSYLLQRMDSYRGVAILTTNMQHALDPAFVRRLRFIVQFPFPDADSRTRIWQRIFPRDTPLGALDFERLAQLNVSGGVIRNIAMHAAFLAAEHRTNIEPRHILAAARIEYAKLDKPLTAAETKGWA
jgi:hypothetical protein